MNDTFGLLDELYVAGVGELQEVIPNLRQEMGCTDQSAAVAAAFLVLGPVFRLAGFGAVPSVDAWDMAVLATKGFSVLMAVCAFLVAVGNILGQLARLSERYGWA